MEAVFFQSQQRSAKTRKKLFYVFCSCGMIFQSAATVDTELDVGMINLAFSDYSWRYGAFAMFGTQWEMALCTRQTGGA